MTTDAEKRLVRLEEDLCFLGEDVRKLEQVVTAQQRQLDSLLSEAKEVKRRLQDILALLTGDLIPGNGAPPHYQEHFWRDNKPRERS